MNSTDNRGEKKHIGYKKCQDGRIVVLEILGEHNENRAGIVDERFAKMRCSMARVSDIYNMHNPELEYEEAFGIYDKTFRYTLGEVLEPVNEFDENLGKVCASGIHYFLTKEPAYYWKYKPFYGLFKSWHSNGQMHARCTYKNRKEDGLYEVWNSNGQMTNRYFCKNGEYDGLYKEWNLNGRIWKRCTYKNGKLDGLYKEWYKTGQMALRCTYKNGELDGLYVAWRRDGQMRNQHTYKNGKKKGLRKSWRGSRMWERYIYKNRST